MLQQKNVVAQEITSYAVWKENKPAAEKKNQREACPRREGGMPTKGGDELNRTLPPPLNGKPCYHILYIMKKDIYQDENSRSNTERYRYLHTEPLVIVLLFHSLPFI